eukprot:g12816.t1
MDDFLDDFNTSDFFRLGGNASSANNLFTPAPAAHNISDWTAAALPKPHGGPKKFDVKRGEAFSSKATRWWDVTFDPKKIYREPIFYVRSLTSNPGNNGHAREVSKMHVWLGQHKDGRIRPECTALLCRKLYAKTPEEWVQLTFMCPFKEIIKDISWRTIAKVEEDLTSWAEQQLKLQAVEMNRSDQHKTKVVRYHIASLSDALLIT